MMLKTLTTVFLLGGAFAFIGCETVDKVNPWSTGGDSVDQDPDTAKVGTDVEDGDADMGLPEYDGVRHAVGVVDFKNEAGWRGRYELGKNMTIMFESALFDTNRFVLVEREELGNVMLEQDLNASGRTAKAKRVAQTGKLRPAAYLATGSVVEVEANESGQSGGIRVRGVRVGAGGGKAQITIIAKLIDSTTGEIVAKKRIVGKAGKSNIKVGVYRRGVGADFGAFQKTPIGEAAQDCINQAARFIALEMEDKAVTGTVVMNANEQVIINRGENHNFKTGMTLTMTEEGTELVDPDSGAILGVSEGKKIGSLEVVKVDEKISYCKVTEGEPTPERGTVVKLEK